MRAFISICLVLSVSSAASGAAAPMRLRVVFDRCDFLSTIVRADALREAAQLWAPYGVVVDAEDRARDSDPSVTVIVAVDTERVAGLGDNGLGEIHFAEDGTPSPHVTLFYRPVERLAGAAQAMGIDVRLGPERLRDQVLARALGRALAHELGHFVLRSPHHASSGLMRSGQRPSTLVEPARKAFVTDVDRARLQFVIAAQPPAVGQP